MSEHDLNTAAAVVPLQILWTIAASSVLQTVYLLLLPTFMA